MRGWHALGRAVQPDGMLGWVQQVGDRPDSVSAQETQFYGAGAFVLAGTAMYDLSTETHGALGALNERAFPGPPYGLFDQRQLTCAVKLYYIWN